MRRFLRAVLVVLAVAYPAALVAMWLALALVGERWWPTTLALYLPRVAFAAPLPLLALALAIWGPRWLLAGQALAAAVILFPLMGLVLRGPVDSDGPKLRLFTCNVSYGQFSTQLILDEIADAKPDVVALQAANHRVIDPLAAALPDFHVQRNGELVIASRWPIVAGGDGGDAFMRATLDTPLGALDVFSAHPISPRAGIEAVRGNGLRSGDALRAQGSLRVYRNTGDRERQVAALGAAARAASHPVLIAGDTNLPGLSPLFREHLGAWQDGFAEVGRGFGYTFPAHRWLAWMRIDRILAGPELRFLRMEVGTRHGSDHYCVWGDVARR